MKIEKVIVGPLDTNCYILSKDKEAIVIDPGDEFEKIKKHLQGLKVIGIIVTHYHFDHIGALNELASETGSKVFDRYNLKEGTNKIGEFKFEVLYTPGHKEDLISIYFKETKTMFCGDFIFNGSIGRWDLEGGSTLDFKESIKKVLQYPKNVVIYPGHGEITTLENERKNLELYLDYFEKNDIY